jgi:uncharacterized repeat protein (TIGR01451 family)
LDVLRKLYSVLFETSKQEVRVMDVFRVNRLVITCALAVMLGMFTCVEAWPAQAAPKLELKMSSEKEVVAVKDGKEVSERVPADKTKSGDVLVYTIEYTNTGSGEARDASVVDPIPESTVYVAGSAEGKGAEITCSVDGGKAFKKEPVKIAVKKSGGSMGERDAEPGQYTHIKWVVKKVPPGGSGKVSFKVKVE